jgi:hypothetical protein
MSAEMYARELLAADRDALIDFARGSVEQAAATLAILAEEPPRGPRICLSCGARQSICGSLPCGH